MIYLRLSLKNVRRQLREYGIYLMTIAFGSMLFYGFSSLQLNKAIIGAAPDIESMFIQLEKITVVISFVMIFLTVYINGFVIKRRMKEFSIYSLIGMRKETISILFFVENLLIGWIGTGVGCLMGICLNYALSGLIIDVFNLKVNNQVAFYVEILVKNLGINTVVFTVAGILNVIKINKYKIVHMIYDARKNEKISPVKKKQVFFFLIAVVMLGESYSALGHYFSNYAVNSQKTNALAWIFLLFMIGIYLLFYSLSSIIGILKKMSFFRQNANIFLLGELTSKIQTNARVMGTLSLVIMLALSAFSLGFIMDGWARQYDIITNIYDVEIDTHYNDVLDSKIDLETNYNEIEAYIESQYHIKDECTFSLFFREEGDFSERKRKQFPALVMKVSDYNKLRNMNHKKSIHIGEDEYAIHYQETDLSGQEIGELSILKEGIKVSGTKLKNSAAGIYHERLGSSLFNDYVGYTIVVPDRFCTGLKVAKSAMVVNTEEKMDMSFCNLLKKKVLEWHSSSYQDLYMQNDDHGKQPINCKLRTAREMSTRQMCLLMRLAGVIIGSILLIMCCTILAIQQLIGGIENKSKYDLLGKLGLEVSEIVKLISKEVFLYFNLPFVIAVISFFAALNCFNKGFGMILQVLFSETSFWKTGVVFPIILFLAVYSAYFVITILVHIRNFKQKKLRS